MNKEDFFEWFQGVIQTPEEQKKQIIEAYIEGRINKDTYLKRMDAVEKSN